MDNKNFITSYSGGKDASLALYKAKNMGYNPIKIFTTFNIEANRSWFHGITLDILEQISELIDIPLKIIPTGKEDDYTLKFEKALLEMKNEGADICVFGDIDIEDHFDYCNDRCQPVGIESFFPLWNIDRKKIVYEFIDLGFKAMINVVDNKILDESFLGKTLTKDLLDEIVLKGADICGENGEYHTFVYDGPHFKEELKFNTGEIVNNGNYSAIAIYLDKGYYKNHKKI